MVVNRSAEQRCNADCVRNGEPAYDCPVHGHTTQHLTCAPDVPYSPRQYEGLKKTGEFTNCGFHHTAAGWIVRDGILWIATFGSGELADAYVAWRSAT
jgi:hypothetical protein